MTLAQRCNLVGGLAVDVEDAGKSEEFSPARHDLGAQAQRAAELLGRGHGLLR